MAQPTWEVLPPEDSDGSTRTGETWNRSGRIAAAFAIAVVSDLASVWLEFIPPLQWVVDLSTAGALFLVLGRQWLLLPALFAEAVPGFAMLPTWVLVVASIAAWGTVTPGGGRSQQP
jgi:hypothetical protein